MGFDSCGCHEYGVNFMIPVGVLFGAFNVKQVGYIVCVCVLGGIVGGEAGALKILPWHAVIFSDYFHRAVDLWGTIIC
jgi:hypothetical protein